MASGNPFAVAPKSSTNPFDAEGQTTAIKSPASTTPAIPVTSHAAILHPHVEVEKNDALIALGNSIRNDFLRGLPQRRGILKKLGGFSLGLQALKSLVDRWVEVRGPVIEYYASVKEAEAPDRKPKGVLILDETSKIIGPVRHDRIPSPFAFIVETRHRKEIFAAGSEEEYRNWVGAIVAVLETLQRYTP